MARIVNDGADALAANDHAPGACRNCGTPLQGDFCGACGERRFDPADRRLGRLLSRAFSAVTDLDGRAWGSLRALLFRPGTLDRDWMAGRRRRWLPPFTLFLLANVAYFVAPLHGDLDLPFDDQVPPRIVALADRDDGRPVVARTFPGQAHSGMTAALVDHTVARRDARDRAAGGDGYDYGDLRRDYTAASGEVSKALLALHLPFIAIALALAMVRSGHFFADHVVVAMHFFAFALLELLVLAHLLRALPGAIPAIGGYGGLASAFLIGLVVLYAVVQVRRGYRVGWLRAVVAAHVMVVGFGLANLFVYRPLQFVATVAWS